MDIKQRFKEAHEVLDIYGYEWYLKQLVSSLYEVGMVSNTPYPTPLASFSDQEDLENIRAALDTLSQDITGMLYNPDPRKEPKTEANGPGSRVKDEKQETHFYILTVSATSLLTLISKLEDELSMLQQDDNIILDVEFITPVQGPLYYAIIKYHN